MGVDVDSSRIRESSPNAQQAFNDTVKSSKRGVEPARDEVECCLFGSVVPEVLGDFIEQLHELCSQSAFEDSSYNILEHHVGFSPSVFPSRSNIRNCFPLSLKYDLFQNKNSPRDREPVWELSYYGPPESSKFAQNSYNSLEGSKKSTNMDTSFMDRDLIIQNEEKDVNVRAVYNVSLSGDVKEFMNMLKYKPQFEYVKEGYKFFFRGVKIELYRVKGVSEDDCSEFSKLYLDPLNPWIISVSAVTEAENIAEVKKVMAHISEGVKNFTNLQVVDHNILQHKIYPAAVKYS